MSSRAFQNHIRRRYRENGRHNLPWRRTRDPWRILVSEVMLQQTQVARVVRYYPKFLAAFPTAQALAQAPLARALAIWQGMGYNRRALYLKRLAGILARDFGGRIPNDPEALRRLPGVGPATAGAIAAFAFGRRTTFLETNIRRVYLHIFFPERRRVPDREILAKIRATLPARSIRAWYYGLMDYGALAFRGIKNPNRRSAHYGRQLTFHGSRREERSRILRTLIRRGSLGARELRWHFGPKRQRLTADAIRGLAADGLIRRQGERLTLAR